MDEIGCAECGFRYDSDENAFCPRCGSQAQAPARAPTLQAVPRTSRGRRRVQAGGIVLVILGGLAMLQFLIAAISPPEPDDGTLELLADVDMFRGLPGGEVSLAASNGTYALLPMDGGNATFVAIGNGTTLDLPTAFMNLTLQIEGQTYYRFLYVPDGERVTVQVMPGDESEAWVSAGAPGALRGLSAFMAFFAGLVVLGGVMAIRLKARKLAYLAIGIAVVPGLFLLLVDPLIGLLLVLLPALAAYLIIQGRREFQ